ncbi:MAG: selenocysteine-specific translation elongation factor [Lachnospiraceae bacterium]|nr:selenocysteine-specific translation elongation factor [Lachnospiraceae bacterium]
MIGTAGHIDHGKTTLVQALTGMDTDRLKEEKCRGISIELGFASFTLPDGTVADVIDVPGHEKFVGNMVTGVMGMDLVLILIAADEGIMPQTREHIAILQELGVKNAILVLSKCDLAEKEWRELVREELRAELKETCFADSPIAEISAVTGEGIPQLRRLILQELQNLPERERGGIFRLPVDRSFTMDGFGTVVTGTLISGQLNKGSNVTIYPSGSRTPLTAKARGLQVHGEETETVYAGQRVAVNLMNITKKEVRRGDVLAPENSLVSSSVLDVKLHLMGAFSEYGEYEKMSFAGGKRELKNRVRLHLCAGTAQVLCRAIWLDRDTLRPGESCYAQLLLEEPLALLRGDRFIVRFYSPVETVGGGVILDAGAKKHKRFAAETLEELEKKENGSPEDVLELMAKKAGRKFCCSAELLKDGQQTREELYQTAEKLRLQQKISTFPMGEEFYFIAREEERKLLEEIFSFLAEFHRNHPYQWGVAKAEFLHRFLAGPGSGAASRILEQWESRKLLRRKQDAIAEFEFQIRRDAVFEKIRQKLAEEFRKAGFDFIRYSNLKLDEGDARDILRICLEEGWVVHLAGDVYTLPDILREALNLVLSVLRQEGKITVVQVRDLLCSSRKSAKYLLEYMDGQRITKKNGTESEREKHDLF